MFRFLITWIVLFLLYVVCVIMSSLVVSSFARLTGHTLNSMDAIIFLIITFILYSILQYAFF